MAKKANIFSEASKLREKHPRKYSDYQDYVTWAKELHGKKTRGAVGKKPPKHKKKKADRKLVPAKGIVHARVVGSVSYHKSQARKQLEEQLAWLLLARDQEKRTKERTKLSKKVALKRQELQKLK